jgi:subtilisin family serine protease
MNNRNLKNIPCNLLPYIKENVISFQSEEQKLGWQITNFNIPDIWKFSKGENVKVAVLDTGIDLEHADLKENIENGANFVEKDLPPQDFNSHGTHVSGIIAAKNNDFGIVGIAPKVKIIPIKVLNNYGAGDMQAVLNGINYAVSVKADIICMSLGTRDPVEEIRVAIENAAKNNTVCFVAAGNAGNTEQLLYPAAYTEAISIGAVDENCLRASFSCTGPNLDFVAPGVKIYSSVPKNTYAYMSGSSMACPFAVGVAALILSSKRNIDPNATMNANDYREVFKENSKTVKNLEELLLKQGTSRFWQGMGIINPESFSEWVELKNIETIREKITNLIDLINMIKNKSNLSRVIKEKELLISKLN